MSDQETTVAELKQLIRTFVDQRDWRQFHTPKNLVMALAVEVAELMEHFQWATAEESQQVVDDREKYEDVSDELADVLGYTLEIANQLDVDLSSSMRRKMVKNEAKYPQEKYRGRYR